MIKKQMRTIGICALAFIVLAAGYFFILEPLLNKSDVVEEEPVELLDGEELGQGNRILITPRADRADIKNVQIKNKIDEYKMVHHLGYDIWYIEDAEMVELNGELLANFVINVGYLLSMMRVAAADIEDGNEILEDQEQFGFNPNNSHFTVTRTDDTWYKIIIGDKIPTSGGYYVMYEDVNGLRPAIYILDTMLEGTILADRYAMMMPLIAKPLADQMSYMFIDNFQLYKGKDLFVELYQAPIPEDSEMLVNHQMRYPTAYTPDTTNYDTVLRTFVSFVGDNVVATDITEEILDEYGFGEYAYRVEFDLEEAHYIFLFSEITENNTYYVTSLDFASIIEISADKVPFLQWDMLKYVDKPVFSQHINDVSEITIITPEKTDVFTLEGLDKELRVTGNGTVLDTENFRQYYKSILYIDWWDYEASPENMEPMLEMIIKLKRGEEYNYKFYFLPTLTRRAYYTINGVGEFYILREKVLKLMSDTELALQNLPIVADAPE